MGGGPEGGARQRAIARSSENADVTISSWARFLTVVDAYPGYCQIWQ
jgi:hypothetical protein